MTITHYLLLFLSNSLWIFGLYELCSVDFLDDDYPEHGTNEDSKGLLWKVKLYSIKYLGWFASKPVCVCPPCMASLHSMYFYWGWLYFSDNVNQYSLIIYIAYAICLVGFNSLVLKFAPRK